MIEPAITLFGKLNSDRGGWIGILFVVFADIDSAVAFAISTCLDWWE